MAEYSFNGGWKFYRGSLAAAAWVPAYDDSRWETVCLPHTVRLEPAAASGMLNYQGEAWYRKHFMLEKAMVGKKVYIRFEAAMHLAQIWVNGKKAAENTGGYLPFIFDITALAVFGEENVIAVKVSNLDNPQIPPGKPQIELDFCYFGGLYRDAELIVKDLVHITDPLLEDEKGGIFVRYENVSAASAEVLLAVHVRNETETPVSAHLTYTLSFDGRVVGQETEILEIAKTTLAEKRIRVDQPRLWSMETPRLYTLTVEITGDGFQDKESLRIGIKDIRFTAEGCLINGRQVILTGANRHQEYPYIGNALPDSLQYRDVKIMKTAGWNIVRTGHYPSDRAFLDACDELGLLVITPTPGWQFYPQQDEEVFTQRFLHMTKQLVRHTRNHACIGFWEPVINEEGRSPDGFRRAAYAIVHKEYPGDQCYCAIDEEYDTEKIFDIIYKRTRAENPEKPGFTREYGDNWKEQYDGYMPKLYRVSRGENTFGGFYPGGQDAMLANMLARTAAISPDGRSTQLVRSVKWQYMENQKGINSGFCLWAGFDHNRGYCRNPALVGAVDFFRIPKYQYYAYQAQNQNGAPMVFIAKGSDDRRVWVVSNCSEILLYTDGIQAGRQSTAGDSSLPSAPVCFLVDSQYHTLRAEGWRNGRKAAEYVWRRPEIPVRIILEYDDMNRPLTADGSDKLMVYGKIVDKNGTVCSHAEHQIRFSVAGPAWIVGDGQERIGANPVKTQAGIGAVLLEAGREAGILTISAQAEGLQTGTIQIRTQKAFIQEIPYRIPKNPDGGRVIFPDETERKTDITEQGKPKNIAKGKPANASSGNPLCGNDGLYDTDWTADPADQAPAWTVDLESVYTLQGVRILWSEDGTTYDFILSGKAEQAADWTVLLEGCGTGQNVQMMQLNNCVARYVRLAVPKASKGTASFAEIELFGKE